LAAAAAAAAVEGQFAEQQSLGQSIIVRHCKQKQIQLTEIDPTFPHLLLFKFNQEEE